MNPPRISIIIGTRGRAAWMRSCLASLAALRPRPEEILVVDQSMDDETEAAVREHAALPGLRYLRQNAVGLSRARNRGVDEAKGDIVVFTDDDCEPATDMVAAVTEVFARFPQAILLFGRVEPGPHDATQGLVPCSRPRKEVVAQTVSERRRLGGMGACMAARREALLQLGGFDVSMGVGARFPAGEEIDLAARALACGMAVVETPHVRAIHRGVRTWRELAALADRYVFGTGAMYGKHLRLWPGATTRVLGGEFTRWALTRPRIEYLREPRRFARFVAFMRGLRLGLQTPLNRATGLFLALDGP